MPAQPLHPLESATLGAWPRPQLDTPVRILGLTFTQWAYVIGAYLLWDAGRPHLSALPALPWWSTWLWAAFCLLLGLVGVLARWHGLHAAYALRVVLREQATPPLSVWRPLPLDWTLDDDDDEAKNDERDDVDEPLATPDNPLGWQDVAPLDGLARHTRRADGPVATGTGVAEYREAGIGIPARHG